MQYIVCSDRDDHPLLGVPAPIQLPSLEIGRGNLRATDDLALKSLDYAAAAGHATVSVQHVIAARKDLWP